MIEEEKAWIPIPVTNFNLCGALFEHEFAFTEEGAIVECSVVQTVALLVAVREQLSVDACAHTFALKMSMQLT
jgi:hypothetical protein